MFDLFLTPALIVGMICSGIYGLFVRQKERLTLIEKLNEVRCKVTVNCVSPIIRV